MSATDKTRTKHGSCANIRAVNRKVLRQNNPRLGLGLPAKLLTRARNAAGANGILLTHFLTEDEHGKSQCHHKRQGK